MLEVRNAAYQASLDFAVLLRTCSGGTWASYRLFHAGMATPIPLAKGAEEFGTERFLREVQAVHLENVAVSVQKWTQRVSA